MTGQTYPGALSSEHIFRESGFTLCCLILAKESPIFSSLENMTQNVLSFEYYSKDLQASDGRVNRAFGMTAWELE